ncbi:MAG: MTH938/NDUFAF3 family protein [bacterium]|nr:MTH938/NDUFAF3 family protein [bacterium]
MPKIDSVDFGSIVIDGKKYHQVLIVGSEVLERDYKRLEELFGTSHKIGDWEAEKLFEENPEIIVIGTGWQGALEVGEDFVGLAREKGIIVIALLTPEAIKFYNEKAGLGQKINALIHTTC